MSGGRSHIHLYLSPWRMPTLDRLQSAVIRKVHSAARIDCKSFNNILYERLFEYNTDHWEFVRFKLLNMYIFVLATSPHHKVLAISPSLTKAKEPDK